MKQVECFLSGDDCVDDCGELSFLTGKGPSVRDCHFFLFPHREKNLVPPLRKGENSSQPLWLCEKNLVPPPKLKNIPPINNVGAVIKV